MSWLGFGPPQRLSRLDEVVAGHLIAQAEARQAGEDAASSAIHARRQTVVARWQARQQARRIRDRRLRTGDVRALVEDMLRDLGPASEKDQGSC